MTKIALLTLHGMGETPEDYAKPFFSELKRRVKKDRWRQIFRRAIYYQDILQFNQEEYYDLIRTKVDWGKLRRFVLFGFSDAASLETQKHGRGSPYYVAQNRILEAFRDAWRNIGPDGAVVVVAQSLGGQVLSNYLWDAMREDPPRNGVWSHPLPTFASEEEQQFCRGRTINRLFTTGCNIPIFVAGRRREDIMAIGKPNAGFEWHNYYDDDDVLGWPLQELSDSYAALVQDHRINAGFLYGPTPMSHVKYWSDRDFLNPLADYLKSLV